MKDAVAAELNLHATEELNHAVLLAGRIIQLGGTPVLGALFGPDDDRRPVVVLSHGLWQQRFGGDPAVIGRLIVLDGEAHEVVDGRGRAVAG